MDFLDVTHQNRSCQLNKGTLRVSHQKPAVQSTQEARHSPDHTVPRDDKSYGAAVENTDNSMSEMQWLIPHRAAAAFCLLALTSDGDESDICGHGDRSSLLLQVTRIDARQYQLAASLCPGTRARRFREKDGRTGGRHAA